MSSFPRILIREMIRFMAVMGTSMWDRMHAVHPDPHLPLPAPGLDVDVRGSGLDGLADDEVRGLDHRPGFGILLGYGIRAPVLHDLDVVLEPGSALGQVPEEGLEGAVAAEAAVERDLDLGGGRHLEDHGPPDAKASERSASRSVGSQVATVSCRSEIWRGKTWNFRATDSGTISTARGSARSRSATSSRKWLATIFASSLSLTPSAFVTVGPRPPGPGSRGRARALGGLHAGALRNAEAASGPNSRLPPRFLAHGVCPGISLADAGRLSGPGPRVQAAFRSAPGPSRDGVRQK
jgi:hypothetical protein